MAQIRAKRSNTATGTKPELLLRRALWRIGARYRLNARDIPGKPDLAFRRRRVVVFCDGDFWHGRDWREKLEQKLAKGTNPDYWRAKIAYNRARDERVTSELISQGWCVLRFWESEIKANATQVAETVMMAVSRRVAAT